MWKEPAVGHDGRWRRRAVLAAGTAGWVMLTRVARAARPPKDEARVTAPEDLMQEDRPHEAREDTVLLPALRTLVSPKQVEALGARMEADEKQVVGAEGFAKAVAEVVSLEKTLGIYELAQCTPTGER